MGLFSGLTLSGERGNPSRFVCFVSPAIAGFGVDFPSVAPKPYSFSPQQFERLTVTVNRLLAFDKSPSLTWRDT